MKTKYTRAELEIRYFESEDIVTASTVVNGPEEEPEKVLKGSANMQGGGTEGIDWN